MFISNAEGTHVFNDVSYTHAYKHRDKHNKFAY